MNIQNRIPNMKAKKVYDLIRKGGTVSKLKLLQQSGMSVSTLNRVVEELSSQDLIHDVGLGRSTGGRKPILYRINPTYAYVFGLDISRLHSKLVLYDLDLNRLDMKSWIMTEQMTPEYLLKQIVQTVKVMLDKAGIKPQSILGMGIGAVGPLDRLSGLILDPLYFSAIGWNNVKICHLLEQQLGFPILLDNGANAAILGEYWADSQHEYEHLLYIHAGVGIRSSMMSNGKVVYGAVDMEGAVGQMIIQFDGLAHREVTGNYGSLETYVSIYALERSAQSALKRGRQSALRQMVDDPEKVTFAMLIKAIQMNDPLAVELFTEAATHFGIGLANLLNMMHPEKVILGGQLIVTNELFFEIATQVATEKTYYYPTYRAVFSKGILGEEALAAGSAIMVMNIMTQ